MQMLVHLRAFRDHHWVKGSQKYLPRWISELLQVNIYCSHFSSFLNGNVYCGDPIPVPTLDTGCVAGGTWKITCLFSS